NIILAWFITFNFVNIAWVFFRAKEWNDAIKVLEGMFGVNGVVLPSFLQNKVAFLEGYGVEFGNWLGTSGMELKTIVWIVLALIISVLFKNSMQLMQKFVPSFKTAFISAFLFLWASLNLNKISEFLYFNF
ncbi:MAG: MBOAT family protein, partial [Bacteroidales bacterium]|nr:MBOAT family protein [Bacteroidales bacterium]